MASYEPISGAVERKYDAVFAAVETDDYGNYLLISGVKVRAYLAGDIVNISVELTDGTTDAEGGPVLYAVHVEGTARQRWSRRAGVPRNLLVEALSGP